MIEAAIVAAAKKAAAEAARPAWTRLKDAALGTPQERALAHVYRLSVAEAVAEASDGLLEAGLADLAEGQLTRLISALPEGDLQPIAAPDEASTMVIVRRWQDVATSLGLDTSTMPVDFERAAAALLRILPERLLAAAGRQDSPLTGRRVVDTLEAVRALVAAMAAAQAGSLGADRSLESALKGAERICRAKRRTMHRPDVLYALLTMRSGAAIEALNAAHQGTAQRVRDRLVRSLRELSPEVGPVPDTSWRQLPDFSLAQQIAVQAGLAEVSDACLLLALLDDSCDSPTMADLRNGLGPQLSVVQDAARALLVSRRPAPTPGSSLGGWMLSDDA